MAARDHDIATARDGGRLGERPDFGEWMSDVSAALESRDEAISSGALQPEIALGRLGTNRVTDPAK